MKFYRKSDAYSGWPFFRLELPCEEKLYGEAEEKEDKVILKVLKDFQTYKIFSPPLVFEVDKADVCVVMEWLGWTETNHFFSVGSLSCMDWDDFINIPRDNRCHYCNNLFEGRKTATKEHVIPKCMGGTCWSCNIASYRRSNLLTDVRFKKYKKKYPGIWHLASIQINHQKFVEYFCANVPETELESAVRNSIHSNFLLHKIKEHGIKKTRGVKKPTLLKIEMFHKTTCKKRKGRAKTDEKYFIGSISNCHLNPLRFFVIDKQNHWIKCRRKEDLQRAMSKLGIVSSEVWYNFKLVTFDGHELAMDADGSWDDFYFNLDICLDINTVN